MAVKHFSSEFDPLTVTFRCKTLSTFDPRIYSKALDALITYGFFILEASDNENPREQLRVFGDSFGNPILHPKSDPDGITEIKSESNKVYLSKSNEEHMLHTDCSYLQTPNADVIMLQCIKSCDDGGDSLLCSGSLLYERMKNAFPRELDILKKNLIGYRRDKQSAKKRVFDEACLDSGNLAMTFRLDDVSSLEFPNSEVEKAYQIFSEIAMDPESVLKFKLKENQTIVVDNMAVMHGRSGYGINSGRLVHRLQLSGCPFRDMLGINVRSTTNREENNESFFAVSN